MALAVNSRRDAWSTIAGFVLQVDFTILRWLDLQQTEVLELERGEDLDLVRDLNSTELDENRLMEQVKRRSAALTLRAADALEAIANFCQHRRANPHITLRFRFVTTAQAGKEQGWSGEGSGIPTWEAIRRGELLEHERGAAIEEIRSVLQKAARPPGVGEGIWQCLQGLLSDSNGFEDFIANFEWSVGSGDISQVEERIKNNLIQSGNVSNAADAEALFDRLFVVVFRRLCSPDLKRLTPEELARELAQRQVLVESDRTLVRFIRGGLADLDRRLSTVEDAILESAAAIQELSSAFTSMASAQNLLATIDVAALAASLEVPELVVPAILRPDAVRNGIAILSRKSSLNIAGEPGSGKTQLSLLIANQLKLPVTWLDIPRDYSVQQACAAVDAVIESWSGSKRTGSLTSWYRSAAKATGQTLLVLDNLPRMIHGDPLTRRIESLALALAQHGGKLLLISYFPLPKTTVEIGNIGEMVAPRLTEPEIRELLIAYGARSQLASRLTSLIDTATRGLPALVAAVARYLAGQSWVFDLHQFEGILKAEFAQGIRGDAGNLIELTVPDPESRELLYRLTLTIGGFSRQTVSEIARVPQPIRLPNEKLDHLLGLWVQPFVGDKFLVSPLIDTGVSGRLDANTRKGVHARLALSIISRKKLDPLDVIACVFHFGAAGLFNQAALIMIQALMAFTEEENAADEWGITNLWASAPLAEEIDINLRLYIRALQTIALDQRGRDVRPVLADLNRLIQEAGETAWGTALASSFIAIRLHRKYPAIANTYILTSLRSGKLAAFPDGSSIPQTAFSLEGLFWATANAASSTADVESWIASVSQLTADQVLKLGASELAQDNSTVLTDGVWLREYRKNESERDWGPVERLVERLETLGKDIGLRNLEAAAIRTRIMILAEWRHDVPAALKLTESTLQRLEDNDSRFLITEVMGRQLSYAGRSEEAIDWLGRARSLEVADHTLWRRNVLITLAEEAGKSDVSLAVKYTAEALEVSRKDLNHDRVIEALAEHAIALWKAGQRDDAFETMEIAVRDLLAGENESIDWKKLLLAVFHTVVYFSSLAHFGSTSGIVGFVPPTQGRFLALDAVDATKFNPAQKSFIRMRMAMLAEGLGKVKSAGEWSDEALKIAASIPDAQTIYSLAWLSIAPALLEAAYGRAVAAALIMANAAVPETDALGRIGIENSENQSRVQQLYQHPAKAASAMLFLAVPLAFQLATLKLQIGRQSDIKAALAQVAATLAGDAQDTVLNGALKAVFIETVSWQELKRRSDELMPKVNDTGSAFIYLVGASTQCPLPQALYLHVWLARQVEKLFSLNRSMRLKLIYPFFEAFWMNAVDASPHQFRTAEAYTRQAVESAGATQSGIGVKALLNSMAFCLGLNLPDDLNEWLSQVDQDDRQLR